MVATPALAQRTARTRVSQCGAVVARRRHRAVPPARHRPRPAAAGLSLRRPRRGGEEPRGVSRARSARHQGGGRRRPGARCAGAELSATRSSSARAGEALAETYAAADVFVFPSRTDTFGLVLLEALASGVPVAAFPVTGPARRDRRCAGRRAERGSARRPASPRWHFAARPASNLPQGTAGRPPPARSSTHATAVARRPSSDRGRSGPISGGRAAFHGLIALSGFPARPRRDKHRA